VDAYTIVLDKDGLLTITADQLQFNITDLIVNGNLTVKELTTLEKATEILTTLAVTGRATLEGTNIVSS
jgi:hypothetical protein